MIKFKTLSFFSFFGSVLKPYIALIIAFNFISGKDTVSESIIPDLKVKLLDGSTTTLHKLSQDGPLLIDFWATWCVPCKKVMKYLNRIILLKDGKIVMSGDKSLAQKLEKEGYSFLN